jgi:ribosomal protein S18 acetylase RimI-like enzyme
MTDTGGGAEVQIRPLVPDDLERVIAIDRKLSGEARRGFYERRLRAALSEPKAFIYVAAWEGDTLVGFALARLLGGEFGRADAVASLDAIGVDPDFHGRGHGRALLAGIDEVMRRKGVRTMCSQSEWTNHTQLRFFHDVGFRHAATVVLERDTAPPLEEWPAGEGG